MRFRVFVLQEIQQEMRDEDMRLQKMMDEEREKALLDEDERRDRLKQVNAKHAHEIKVQLHGREMAKLMEAERIEEEAKSMAKAQIIITMDMLERERVRKEEQLRVRRELQKSNELAEYFKNRIFEEQRISEMKAQQYQLAKQERDRQLAADKRLLKEQKQREADRMLALQTRMLNTKNDQEEMTMRRSQEEKEREFRRKEKEAAAKRIATEKDLEAARMAQLNEIKRTRALNIVRDEIDFQHTVSKLKEDEAREQERKQHEESVKRTYRQGNAINFDNFFLLKLFNILFTEIMNQISQKEMARRQKEMADRKEFMEIQQKEQERIENIRSIIDNKMSTLRQSNIPDSLIKDMECKLQTEPKFFK